MHLKNHKLFSKLVSYIIGASKWSNFETNKEIFWAIPHPEGLPDDFTDDDIYDYFNLSEEQINRIESKIKIGLESYVPLIPPEI